MEDVDIAKKEAGHPVTGIVYSVPAPEMQGTLSEKVVMYETAAFGEYELKGEAPIVGAVQVGVDPMGKSPNNDHTDLLTFMCAEYRHLGNNDTIVAEGTPHEYCIHLDRNENKVVVRQPGVADQPLHLGEALGRGVVHPVGDDHLLEHRVLVRGVRVGPLQLVNAEPDRIPQRGVGPAAGVVREVADIRLEVDRLPPHRLV